MTVTVVICEMLPEVPVTVTMYVPAVVPGRVVPVLCEEPPQPTLATETASASSPSIASQLRRLGMRTSRSRARAVPPAEGQKSVAGCLRLEVVVAVVDTVSTTVGDNVLLTETEETARAHPGRSLGAEMLVVTAQVSPTVPLNPFVGVTVTVDVLALVAPALTAMLPPLVSANPLETAAALPTIAVSPRVCTYSPVESAPTIRTL